jgi:release factor glutamine methyltransferase
LLTEPDTFFHYDDLEIRLHPQVYNPAEDTFLLLETIDVTPDETVLEIGTGCGVIALACARQGNVVVCTDCNRYAVALTKQNILKNAHLISGSIEVRRGSLFSPIHTDEIFDVILWNPPYLPTSPDEKVDHWFDMATDGGMEGIEVTLQFLNELQRYLAVTGRAYFVFSSLSNREKLERCMKQRSLHYTILKRQQFHGETLDIYCVTRRK